MSDEPATKKQKAGDGEARPAPSVVQDSPPAAAASPSGSASASGGKKQPPVGMRDDMLGLKLIKQGAEGRVYECTFLGQPCIMKERFTKGYRHPVLDHRLTSARLAQEVRCMLKSRRPASGREGECVYSPAVYLFDEEQRRIYMEKIEGVTVKEKLHELDLTKEEDEKIGMELAVKIGKGIANLHSRNILHGDLTTSNLMLTPSASDPLGTLVVLDFGLASVSRKHEEYAVDLYVLERAFLSTHPNTEKMFSQVLNTYRESYGLASKVLAWLLKVRARGRKREMVG